MKKITLTENNTFQHLWIPGLHNNIPENAIDVEDNIFMVLSQDPSKKYNQLTKTTSDYIAPFVLLDAQKLTISRLQSARDNAITQPITSNALGSDHLYSTVAENRNFLNNLITLGNGSKFTCINGMGNKARLVHTHAELMQLGLDIEANISSHFDHYELKLAEVAQATTQSECDAVVW